MKKQLNEVVVGDRVRVIKDVMVMLPSGRKINAVGKTGVVGSITINTFHPLTYPIDIIFDEDNFHQQFSVDELWFIESMDFEIQL